MRINRIYHDYSEIDIRLIVTSAVTQRLLRSYPGGIRSLFISGVNSDEQVLNASEVKGS